jgi:hypothetical protein
MTAPAPRLGLAGVWLAQIYADPQATDDIRKVAAAIADCALPGNEYITIGGGSVYADEFLFQLADDVTDLRAVVGAIHWLTERGYLDIVVNQTSTRGSVLMCALVAGSQAL